MRECAMDLMPKTRDKLKHEVRDPDVARRLWCGGDEVGGDDRRSLRSIAERPVICAVGIRLH